MAAGEPACECWQAGRPGGDVVRELQCDPAPGGAVDSAVDGGLVELERRAAHIVHRGGEALLLNLLPRVHPERHRESKTMMGYHQ